MRIQFVLSMVTALSFGSMQASGADLKAELKKEIAKKGEKKKDEKAAAGKCVLEVHGTDAMTFEIPSQPSSKDITISKSCKEFTIELKHTGKFPKNVMGHNWLVSETKDAADIQTKAAQAGMDKDFLPVMPDKILGGSKKMLGGGESETIKFSMDKLKVGGDYTYFCTFVGHNGSMRGKVNVTN